MGDINQYLFIQKYAEEFSGPFLEIGSKDYGSTQDLRPLFSGKGDYIGIDQEAGKGVDQILDITDAFEKIDEELNHQRFGTIFCLSVLEHCQQPFTAAANLTRLLKTDGQLCISVPFSWKIHAYPNDYWLFTPEGVRKLFSEIKFDRTRCTAEHSNKGDLEPIDDHVGKIPFSFTRHRKQGHPLRGISAKCLKMLSRIGLLRWLSGHAYVLAPTNIIMVGKKNSPT